MIKTNVTHFVLRLLWASKYVLCASFFVITFDLYWHLYECHLIADSPRLTFIWMPFNSRFTALYRPSSQVISAQWAASARRAAWRPLSAARGTSWTALTTRLRATASRAPGGATVRGAGTRSRTGRARGGGTAPGGRRTPAPQDSTAPKVGQADSQPQHTDGSIDWCENCVWYSILDVYR